MSTPSLQGSPAGRDSRLRAADADRERVAEQLQASHAEGRLDLNEFQQRLERCYAAKTFGELGELVSDLPRRGEPSGPLPARRGGAWGGRGWLLPVIALLLVFMAASSAAWHHGHHPFFLVLPLVFVIWRMSPLRRGRWSAGSRGGPGGWA